MIARVDLSRCRSPVWAKGGHLQTVMGHYFTYLPFKEDGERIELKTEDGDTLVGAYFAGTSDAVVYAFHGLGGNISADYMRSTARVARDQGHSVFLMNHRGCGEGAGLARGPYHSGRAEDISLALAWGHARFKGKKHIAIGYSLSGNALLLLASGERGTVKPDAAMAVNSPIDLDRVSQRLQRGFNRIYDLRFVDACRRDILTRMKQGLIPEYRIPPWATLRDIDEIYTAKAGGFRDRAHYYATCSAKPHLKKITLPTVLLTAKDDPFVDVGDYLDAQVAPGTHLHIEDEGGHLGYLTQKDAKLNPARWLDEAVAAYLPALTAAL